MGERFPELHKDISPQGRRRCTGLEKRSSAKDTKKIPKERGETGLAKIRIQTHDLRVQHRGECDPRRIRNEGVSGGPVDFVGGGNVADDAGFQREDVGEREHWTALSEEEFGPLRVGRELGDPQSKRPVSSV